MEIMRGFPKCSFDLICMGCTLRYGNVSRQKKLYTNMVFKLFYLFNTNNKNTIERNEVLVDQCTVDF